MTSLSKDIIFELGTEELPATNLADLFESPENPLKAKWEKIFQDHRIAFESSEVWATPRRLVFYLKNVSSVQSARDQLTKLMAQSEAAGADGKPTEKFLTILKHRNAQLAETVISDVNGKPHVFIKKAEPVRKTAVILPEILEALVPTLGFPKNMKWDASGLYFPRPIRSTFCFFGSICVRYKIADVRSGDKTVIFSKAKRTAHTVTDAASYFKLLKKQNVVLDPVERKKTIQSLLDKMAKSYQGRLYDDPFLMNEVNFLVEDPNVLNAPFDAQFLKLPVEVLAVSMARKQRIFGLADKEGKLLPRFLAVSDRPMNEKEKKLISKNCENILHAKLQDSLFFYREDMKTPLENKTEELKKLIFLKNAGSMRDKTERLEKMAESFHGEDMDRLKRAARLSKCDLLTHMVGEFPELQGIMGKYYALAAGEPKEVAEAIGEQYLPRTVSDRVPETRLGAFLSVLDKCDLISTCFALGLQPTSSMDPYALRRSGSALFKILIKHDIRLDVSQLVSRNLDLLKPRVNGLDGDAVAKKIMFFLQDRLRSVLTDQGFFQDIVDAVLVSGFSDIPLVFARVSALSRPEGRAEVLKAAKVIERTSNILKGNKEALPSRPNRDLFAEDLEHAVMDKLQQCEPAILDATRQGDFGRATSLYAEAFFDILNQFFDKVFIHTEDMNVRKNRLSLLRNVKELYTRDIADLSKLQVNSTEGK